MLTHSCSESRNLEASISRNIQELSRPVMGILSFLLYILVCVSSASVCYNYICMTGKVKVKTLWSVVTKNFGRNIDLLLHDSGTRWSECSEARPGRTLALGNTRYPFYTMLYVPQLGLEGLKISFARGFDSGPPSPCSDAIPNELYGTHTHTHTYVHICLRAYFRGTKNRTVLVKFKSSAVLAYRCNGIY